CGDYSESLGARLFESAARILLWQEWKAGAARCSAFRSVWKNCLREYGFGRRDGSSFFDFGSAACGAAVARPGDFGLTSAANLVDPTLEHGVRRLFEVQKFNAHSDARLHDANYRKRFNPL